MAEASADLIIWREVSHRYRTKRGEIEALGRISARIQRNQCVSIVGPSGCGKSTLLHLTGGLIRASGGEILLEGQRLDAPQQDMGFVFQRDLLLEWRTNLANVLLPAEVNGLDRTAARRRALELLGQTGLAGFEDRWPRELSGGMRQRVAICRALLSDPHLLLMDEPFGALDALTRRQMAVDLEQLFLKRRKTILFVTHDINEAILLGDRVIVLSQRPGEILADILIELPRPRALTTTSATFQEYARRITRLFEEIGVLRIMAP